MRFSFIPASQYADRDFELGCDLINAPMDGLPGFKLGPIAAEVLQRDQTTRCARNRMLNIPRAASPGIVPGTECQTPGAHRPRHAVSLSPDWPVFPRPGRQTATKKPIWRT